MRSSLWLALASLALTATLGAQAKLQYPNFTAEHIVVEAGQRLVIE